MIVNYNDWTEVARLVSTLAEAKQVRSGACEVVVVDNASEGPVPPEFRAQRAGIRVIVRGENGGFAAGVNTGWKSSNSPWLLVLNPDVVAGAEVLGQVLDRLDHYEGDPGRSPGIVGFGLRNADGSRQPSVGPFPSLLRSLWGQLIPRYRRKYQAGWRTRRGPVAWVTGACFLVNSRLLGDLGGMDEDFFLYYEEVALCRSARLRGWGVEFDPSVEVIHLHPLQGRRVSPSMRVITRHSKLLYFRKYLPRWQFVALSLIVLHESRLRGLWARLRGDSREDLACKAIGRLATAMRGGSSVRGPAVRMLAEEVAAPGRARSKKGHAVRRLQLRKDGPE